MKKQSLSKLKKPLVVIIKNPPTKEEAKAKILEISKELNYLYSQKSLNVMEEIK